MAKVPVMFKIEGDKVVDQLKIADFLKWLNEKIYALDKENYPSLCKDDAGNPRPYEIFTAEFGQKYVKIVGQHTTSTSGGQRGVYCFLDYAGNIYKSATWAAPAKYIRGTVWDKDHSWGKGLNRYGGTYLR